MDPNVKLRQLLDQRGWSEYRLAKEAGLAESTVINIFKRNTVPSIPTLEMICGAFGLTLAQFFAEDTMIEASDDFRALFDAWKYLTPTQKQAVIALLQSFSEH